MYQSFHQKSSIDFRFQIVKQIMEIGSSTIEYLEKGLEID